MAVKSITGTFMGQDIYYIGYPMPDGWTYFNDAMLRRCRTSATSPITYVETGMDYYQSQRWSPTEGFSLTMKDFSPDDVTGGGGSVAPDASVEAAVLWAIQIANDDTHGYDQANRNGPDSDRRPKTSICCGYARRTGMPSKMYGVTTKGTFDTKTAINGAMSWTIRTIRERPCAKMS